MVEGRRSGRREGPLVFLVNEVLGDYAAAAAAYVVWTVAVLVLVPAVLPTLGYVPLGFWGILITLLLGLVVAAVVHVLATRS